MKTWLRARPRGMLGFVLIASLVAGGLGWASAAALRLEQDQLTAQVRGEHAERQRTQQRERDQRRQTRERERARLETEAQTEFASRLRLAMWRLDSRIARVLAPRTPGRITITAPCSRPRRPWTPAASACRTGRCWCRRRC